MYPAALHSAAVTPSRVARAAGSPFSRAFSATAATLRTSSQRKRIRRKLLQWLEMPQQQQCEETLINLPVCPHGSFMRHLIALRWSTGLRGVLELLALLGTDKDGVVTAPMLHSVLIQLYLTYERSASFGLQR